MNTIRSDNQMIQDISNELVKDALKHFSTKHCLGLYALDNDWRYLTHDELKKLKEKRGDLNGIHLEPIFYKDKFLFWELSSENLYEVAPWAYYSYSGDFGYIITKNGKPVTSQEVNSIKGNYTNKLIHMKFMWFDGDLYKIVTKEDNKLRLNNYIRYQKDEHLWKI